MAGLMGGAYNTLQELDPAAAARTRQIVATINRLRGRGQGPQMAGAPTSQGVFTPGIFGPIGTLPAPGTYGGGGPFGPMY